MCDFCKKNLCSAHFFCLETFEGLSVVCSYSFSLDSRFLADDLREWTV